MGNCVSSVIDLFRSFFPTVNSCTSTDPQRQIEQGESSTSTAWEDMGERESVFDGITPQASSSSSPVTKKGPYDVFINHRGCDTKHKLASTIYHALDLVGLHASLDIEKLELGDSIPNKIQQAMRTAGIHIAIFSERYAESPWCLAELSFMFKTGSPIIPVFYHVKPDDLRWVRKGKGLYAPAFSQYTKKARYSSNLLEEWKTALERVSNLFGHELNSKTGDEGMLLKSIVNSVFRVIKKEPLCVAKHPVGMDEIVEDFERSRQKCIESERQVQIVGIVGFGGSGKTTLATELYNRKSSSFNRSSFLHDVRDAASKNALHTKQNKLLEDLQIKNYKSFDNVKAGNGIVEDRLKSLCVLIVLDDVDHEDQLDALLPRKESLGSGSLIIVTTREGDVLTKCGITSIYRMQPLQHLHAKQLFCWHAFLQPFPLISFEGLVKSFLDVCNGLPLSLKVIGGQLYGQSSKDYWVCQLDKIRRILPKEIMQILKVSYDALDEDEQEIFLDIACFFIGERTSSAIAVWDGSGWSGLCSWETLHNKCLVEVDEKERIRMHDHLRDLGREIAKTRSPLRLWFERQSMDIQRGMPIRGIMAAAGLEEENELPRCPPPFKEYMEMMRISNGGVGLQLLDVKENDFTQECGELSRGLLWLRWLRFQHGSIPSWLSLENIRVLELLGASSLKALWEDAHPPLQLRELQIKHAHKLQSLPRSIDHLKHLKRLALHSNFSDWGQFNLPEEFCRLQSLEHLALTEWCGLSSLPSHFGDLVNLRHIDLSGCYRLEVLPVSFKQLIHLEYLCLSRCHDLTLESDILGNITNLKVFDVSECRKIQVLPHNVTNQSSLEKLDFGYTASLRELPASIGQLSKLKELEIVRSPLLTRLPISLGNLSNLATLVIADCEKLESLPIEVGQLCSLKTLKIERCPELYEIPSLAALVSLITLTFDDCHKIKKIEGLQHLKSLEELFLGTCWMVPSIDGFGGTERLRKLDLKAENLSAFQPCIQSLQIENWPWVMTICGRIFSRVQSILDSFTFPGLAVVDSPEREFEVTRLTCWETNLSNAAVACFLVRSPRRHSSVVINEDAFSTFHKLSRGEWIGISVFREVSPLIKDGGRSLEASITLRGSGEPPKVVGGRLLVGERSSVVEGFKHLLQTLCDATSMS